jgi:formate hydrogenlyase transcriptional activator
VILTRGKTLEAPLSELHHVSGDQPAQPAAAKNEEEIARIVKDTISSLRGKRALDEHARKQHDEIVRVLTECKGRVGGPDGAAALMGISRTTLISRIKKLNIDPYQYA